MQTQMLRKLVSAAMFSYAVVCLLIVQLVAGDLLEHVLVKV